MDSLNSDAGETKARSAAKSVRWPRVLESLLRIVEELGLLVFLCLLAAGGLLAASYYVDLGAFDLRPHQMTLVWCAFGFALVATLSSPTLHTNLFGLRGRWNPPRAIVADAHRGQPILFEARDTKRCAFSIGRERYASDLQLGTIVYGVWQNRVQISRTALTISFSTSVPCFYLRVIPIEHITDVEIALRFHEMTPHAVAVFHLSDEGELKNVIVQGLDADARRWRNAWLVATSRGPEDSCMRGKESNHASVGSEEGNTV